MLKVFKVFGIEDFKYFTVDTKYSTQEHIRYLKNRTLKYIEYNPDCSVEEKKYLKGVLIPLDKVDAISRVMLSDKNCDSLYELLTTASPNGLRDSSIFEFFEISKEKTFEQTITWLSSVECAFEDNGTELPVAIYYEEIDKYQILSGQNRAFCALLLGAKEYRVSSIIHLKKDKPNYAVDFLNNKVPRKKSVIRRIKGFFFL